MISPSSPRKNILAGHSLRELGKMMKQASEETAKITTEAGLQLTPEDDLLTCIWKVLADNKGRTPSEVLRIVDNVVETDLPEVDHMLQLMYTNSWCTKAKHHSKDQCIYTLKKGINMSALNTTHKTSGKFPGAQTALNVPDASGMIKATEGLDVCIWKAMQDRKPRTMIEIGKILQEYGIERVATKNRVMALMMKGWFKRVERGADTFYTLHKEIAMPIIAGATAPVKHSVAPGTDSGRTMIKAGDQLASDHTQLEKTVSPLLQAPVEEKPAAKPVLHTITKNDGIFTSVWKVMADRDWYSARDLEMLLEGLDIRPHTVSARLSELNNTYHWFEVKKAPTGRGNLYQLKEGIAMPENEAPYARKNSRKDQPAQATPTLSGTQSTQQLPLSPSAPTPVPVSPQISAPVPAPQPKAAPSPAPVATGVKTKMADPDTFVVEIAAVKFKGITMSADEAREVCADLKQRGYGSETGVFKSSRLQLAPIMIDNQAFSGAELNQLVSHLSQLPGS